MDSTSQPQTWNVAKFLENMRSWPPEKKKRAVVWATAALMALVVAIWLLFFNNLPGKSSFGAEFFKNSWTKLKEIINNYQAPK